MEGALETRIRRRVERAPWPRLAAELDRRGYALTPPLLTLAECRRLAALFDDDACFRKTVEMERLRFGAGRYRYLARPLPRRVAALREALYGPLAEVANRWAAALGEDTRYPPRFATWLRSCHAAGQEEPTPLLLRYEEDGYNCLHQDLYGDVAFPLQAACTLDAPGEDYEGGEFLLVEQRPRMQSRGEAIPLEPGRFVLFPNAWRPVAGVRGAYRVTVRHGISRVRRGTRRALGIIFHDART